MTDPLQILIVDDNVRTAELVGHMLEGAGRRVQLELGGEAALRWFEEHRDEVAAVVLDEGMPDLDGHVVAEHMWRQRPGLPIFLMSGFDEQEIAPLLSAYPFKGFLKKPFRNWELQLRVQSILGM